MIDDFLKEWKVNKVHLPTNPDMDKLLDKIFKEIKIDTEVDSWEIICDSISNSEIDFDDFVDYIKNVPSALDKLKVTLNKQNYCRNIEVNKEIY